MHIRFLWILILHILFINLFKIFRKISIDVWLLVDCSRLIYLLRKRRVFNSDIIDSVLYCAIIIELIAANNRRIIYEDFQDSIQLIFYLITYASEY
jgi:hypothetical protein